MLKRKTLGLLFSAIALTGGVVLLENHSRPQQASTPSSPTAGITDSEAQEKLFPIEEKDIDQFSLSRVANPKEDNAAGTETETEKLSFTKDDDGTWQMTEPENALAESAAIAFLLNQLTNPSARAVTTDAADTRSLEEFGLTQPNYTIVLSENGNEYTVLVGGLDFAQDKRYVQTTANKATEDSEEPADTSPKIYVISGGIINAVNRPTSEWLAVDDTAIEESGEETEEVGTEETGTEETNSEETDPEENAEAEKAQPESP